MRLLKSVSISRTFEIATNIFTIFFAFLDDLGNFKHFEPYLFFVKKLVALLNRRIAEVQPLYPIIS